MKYRVRLSLPALVEVVVDVDAESQQDAIVAGYDHALAATPQTVSIVSVSPQSAMLEACDALPVEAVVTAPAPVETVPQAAPPAAAPAAKRYSVRFYATPESFEQGQPDREERLDEYNDAVELCRALADEKTDYIRRVHDKFGNKLFEMKNEVGRFVVVVYADDTAFAARRYQPWSGWHLTAKEAKKAALSLLDAGKVYAVGVIDANVQPATLLMNLSRSSS